MKSEIYLEGLRSLDTRSVRDFSEFVYVS